MKIAVALAVLVAASADVRAQDYSDEAFRQKREERKANIQWALKYATDQAWNYRLSRPKLSLSEMGKINTVCEMLGEFRAQEAVRIGFVGLTLQTISFRYELDRAKLHEFPYVRMLIQIGRPSASSILSSMKVATYDGNMSRAHKNVLRLQAYILRETIGHEAGLARLEEILQEFRGTDAPQVRELLAIYKLRESEADIRRAFRPEPPN